MTKRTYKKPGYGQCRGAKVTEEIISPVGIEYDAAIVTCANHPTNTGSVTLDGFDANAVKNPDNYGELTRQLGCKACPLGQYFEPVEKQ